MIAIVFAFLLALIPALLAYKLVEKRNWMDSLKGGAIATGLMIGVEFVIGLILVSLGITSTIILTLAGIGVFFIIYYILKAYIKRYALKNPIVFFIVVEAISYVLLVLLAKALLASIGYESIASMMSVVN